MPNVKIIYSLRLHIELQKRGFQYEVEMKNPTNPQFNCWVYTWTPELATALDALMGEDVRNG